jgi:hypothetical protein
MTFQIHALDPVPFSPLFAMSNEDLKKVRAIRKTVVAKPGYPCRVSLVDAEVGETVILVNHQHQSAESPFQASHAIYVREQARQAFPRAGTVPELFLTRLISVRAFDERHIIINADVVEGVELSNTITIMMRESEVAYLHLHNAALGCYLARVTRA